MTREVGISNPEFSSQKFILKLALAVVDAAAMLWNATLSIDMVDQPGSGERQGIAQRSVHAIEAEKNAARNVSSAATTSVRAPGLQINVNTLLCDALGLAEE